MLQPYRTIYTLFIVCLLFFITDKVLHSQHHTPFTPNQGQWEEDFHHKIKLRWGQIFFSQNKLIIDAWDAQQYAEILECMHHAEHCNNNSTILNKHAYEIEWLNTNSGVQWKGEGASAIYVNYYLGNNPSRWKSQVYNQARIVGHNMWNATDIIYYEKDGFLKYDIVLKPGSLPEKIKFKVKHANKVQLIDGALVIKTAVGEIKELSPYVYQKINGQEIQVPCSYTLKNNIVGFKLLSDYDASYPLIIDPQIIFSTFSGSTGDNWGTTATYDAMGNAYGGGILFNMNYPTTAGAYQTNLAGNCDVAITKYNPTGNSMLFSTLLGGGRGEIPYSMVVDENDNLIVMGTTGSSNFPVTAGAYDQSFNGGTNFGLWGGFGGNFLANYPEGSDFFVTKFNPQGTQLLGSTFVGGTRNEGFNVAASLNHNYGDNIRGEVMVDANNDIYVISTTQSIDFPVLNAFQNSFGGGGQDAAIFKLNAGLSNLMWSSYFGGSSDDAGYGVQIGANGSVYFCGGTMSSSITGMNGLHSNNQGGVDGFVARCPINGGSLQNASFIGSSQYDQVYFVQIDSQGDIFLMGQTHGNYPVVAPAGQNIFSSPNGSIFLHKLNPTLNQTGWCTRFGNNNQNNKLVPGAFLVDNCNFISFSLWAGNSNTGTSTTTGLPVTNDAYQSTTDGSDFYLGILKHDAEEFHYGTFFGGPVSGEHVDGGTSRFDKNGIIYQAICAGCGSNNDMPTTPGAFSNTNNSNNCNMAVIKFDLSEYSTIIGLPAQEFFCSGNTVQFTNLSTGNNSFIWYFGDGNSSTAINPIHTYQDAGIYEVLLVSDGNSLCSFNDTARVMIEVQMQPSISFNTFPPICNGDSIQLIVSGGTSYQWQAAQGLSMNQLNSSNPVVAPNQTTTYTVTTSNNCGSATGSIIVEVIDFDVSIFSPDNTLCLGDSIVLQTNGGINHIWEPTEIIITNNGSFVELLPLDDVMVYLTAFNDQNCRAKDSLQLFVLTAPQVAAPNDTIICFGTSLLLNANSPFQTTWTNLTNGNQQQSPSITVQPETSVGYELFVSNQCGSSRDSVWIDVSRIYPEVGPDVEVCHSTPVQVFATGGLNYLWLPQSHFQSPNLSQTVLIPQFDTKYTVIISNEIGCSIEEELPVRLFPRSLVSAGPDKMVPFGGTAQLEGSATEGNVSWSPVENLSCINCLKPEATLTETTEFTITLIDTFGCKYTDKAKIMVEGSIYVPNAFTPNGDGVNDVFMALGVDVIHFRMDIFTRNGELIFTSKDIMKGWDGMVNGREAQMDVYVYVIYYTLNSGETKRAVGRVTLVQ